MPVFPEGRVVRPVGAPWDGAFDTVLCQGESGSGASLDASGRKSDRQAAPPGAGCPRPHGFRGVVCAECEASRAGVPTARCGWLLCRTGRAWSQDRARDLKREKGIRWMPWHQEAMKDVARCEKPRGAASRL